MAARTLDEILEDFRKAAERFDPDGKRADWLWDAARQGKKPEQMGGEKCQYFRLLKFQRFLEREDHRIAGNPDQLRPIAMAEALDSLVRPDVQQHLQTRPPKHSWLELLCPYESAPDAARLRTLTGHTNRVTSVSWSGNGRRIVSGSGDDTVKVWDAASGACLATLTGHLGRVETVSWSPEPEGRRIVSGGHDETVKVWDAVSGACLATLTGHMDEVRSVSWSPDGKRIVSGSFDETVWVWDAASGAALPALTGHKWNVTSVSWSGDGKRIVSGSYDKTVKVWDAASGRVWPRSPGTRTE